MYNSSQLLVLNSNGSEKYFGSVDGTVKDFFKLGWNKYLLVMDTGVNVIKDSVKENEMDISWTWLGIVVLALIIFCMRLPDFVEAL